MTQTIVNLVLGIGQIILGLQSNDKAAQVMFITLGSITLVVQALQKKLTRRKRGIVTIIALFPLIGVGIICGG